MQKLDMTPIVTAFAEFFSTTQKEKIDELLRIYPTRRSLETDYRELERFDPDLADKLIREPDTHLEAAEQSIRDMNRTLPVGSGKFEPHVRIFNLPNEDSLIENLTSKNINELVAVKAVVTKRTEVMHRVKIAVYECQICEARTRAIVTKNFVPPKRCEDCKKFALKQLDDESNFTDIQKGEVQELLERLHGGAPAARIEIWMEDDQVNSIAPGDNIELVGILRLRPPLRTRQRQELVYSRFLEIIHIQSMKKDFEEIDISREEEREIVEFSKRPDVDQVIVDSVAPGIYGHLEVKKAVALQLFGGTKGKTMKGGVPIRDDIHVLLIGDPGLAKCVEGNTNILLADGSIQKISDIVEETLAEKPVVKEGDGVYALSNHDLLSLGTSGRIGQSKGTVFWKLAAPSEMYRIRTYTGKEIVTTPQHPFFVSYDGFMKPVKASDIDVGEFIATPRSLPITGTPQKLPSHSLGRTNAFHPRLPEFFTPAFGRLVGYLTGDGYLRRTTSYEIGLTNRDEDLLADFTRILESYGLKPSLRLDKRNGLKTRLFFSVELGEVLEKLGMGADSFSKSVPLEIARSPNDVVKEFIKAYYDCEGSVNEAGIAVVSASKCLLEQIQILLLRFGIRSQLHPTRSRATNSKLRAWKTYYRLYLCGENARRYLQCIGFTSKKKMNRKKVLEKDHNPNLDVIPHLKNILKQTRHLLFLSPFECGVPRTTYQHLERGDRNPSHVTFRRILAAFTSRFYAIRSHLHSNSETQLAHALSILKTISRADVFWDRIISKEKIPSASGWVYDLQVDSTHNFVANGVIAHNTKFLQHAAEIAPKSIYASGKTTTGAGLTVTAEKDELGEGGWTLKAGALVLASGGVAMIDEFDKIEEEDRSSLHEAMESQYLSIAKAGIVAKFRSKTAILAAANPKYGRFDVNKNLADQYEIPPTLLSRFDLIFPIIDVLDVEKDTQLAEHILATHLGKEAQDDRPRVERDFLRKYIAYARRKILPKLTTEATELIKQFYVEMRSRSKDAGSVAITPRYLEGLVRLSEANAKMRLSETVDAIDAQTAIGLMNYVMRQVMTDKATGLLDVDTVATGKPKSERDRLQKVDTILDIIRDHLRRKDSAEIETVVKEANTFGVDESTALRIIRELLSKGTLYENEHGHVRIVGER